MAIHAVVGGIELALEEPGVVAVEEGAAVYGLEIFRPGEEGTRLTGPVFVWVGDGFFVEGLVFFEAWCGRVELGFAVLGVGMEGRKVERTTEMRFARMLYKSYAISILLRPRTRIFLMGGKARNQSQENLLSNIFFGGSTAKVVSQ